MNKLKYIILSFLIAGSYSCESLVEGINDNPNNISSDSFDAGVLLLKGIEIANVTIQSGHLTRIGGMWSGQTKGVTLLYKSIYEYNLSAEETNPHWEFTYQGVVKQARTLREHTKNSPKAAQYSGITKVLEANALGTVASLYGDIPYSEISNDEIDDPKFDTQTEVFAKLQILLDEAIAELGSTTTSPLAEDFMLAGNVVKWGKVAHTIKARLYTYTREYDKAYQEALKGVLAPADGLIFTPPNIGYGSVNMNYKMINERGGYWGFTGSHLENLLTKNRLNAKTDEAARYTYYNFDGNAASNNKGIFTQDRPIVLVGYEENLLILAETAARAGKLDESLGHLNMLRSYLASGKAFQKLTATDGLKYDAYVLADFEQGGMENMDNLTPARALLREIIEERYVSGFAGLMPFDDIRRLGVKEKDIAVLPPFNSNNTSKYPQRFIVAQTELNANSNAPKDPGIFAETAVNK
ncbi:Susd and RagB outer membrane lipoprotein [Spirosomataceae bacterium TFI 002]|nr:Susd and RagB outer membrane lipoprotein [Spirosomataceae bacterium TFI 002]